MAEGMQSPELRHERKPIFDGGSFTIEYLSISPNGFEVVTDKSLRRRNPIIAGGPRPPIPLNSEQKGRLKKAMVDQIKFAEGIKTQEALAKFRGKPEDQSEYLQKSIGSEEWREYERLRAIYQKRAVPIVALRNIRQQNDSLTVDIKPADFPTYKEFAKKGSSSELLELAVTSSTSMALVTKDKRLIVQYRSPKNPLYGGVPGASVAGYLDGKPYIPSPTESAAEKRGTLQPIDTNFIKDNAIKEANEELGLDGEDFQI